MVPKCSRAIGPTGLPASLARGPPDAVMWQNRRMSREPMPVDALIDTVRQWIGEARSVVALTGAGISTDSGIPDFRGPQGVWTKNPEAEKMATLQNYVADKDVRKRAWLSRLETPYLTAEPNAGHHALVALERRGKLDTLITQNVDGLHIKAGASPQRVI